MGRTYLLLRHKNISAQTFFSLLSSSSSNVTTTLKFSYLCRARRGAKEDNVYTFSHLRNMCSWGDNQPPVAPQRGTNQALTPWLFSPNVAAAAEPLHRFNVSATNWLPTGIQGAKEPLDGQRLEVYPAINASEILTLQWALFIRSRYKGKRGNVSSPQHLLSFQMIWRFSRAWAFTWSFHSGLQI